MNTIMFSFILIYIIYTNTQLYMIIKIEFWAFYLANIRWTYGSALLSWRRISAGENSGFRSLLLFFLFIKIESILEGEREREMSYAASGRRGRDRLAFTRSILLPSAATPFRRHSNAWTTEYWNANCFTFRMFINTGELSWLNCLDLKTCYRRIYW